MKYEADAGRQLFTEEVYEQQMRVPGGTWLPAPNTWTDARGDPASKRDEIACPDGWKWRDLWAVSRHVQSYSCLFARRRKRLFYLTKKNKKTPHCNVHLPFKNKKRRPTDLGKPSATVHVL